jgi:hypothetical protein
MKKNITLSADAELIQKAREKAKQERFSLNSLFQNWQRQYIQQENAEKNYLDLMKDLSYAQAGKKFSRDDLNER